MATDQFQLWEGGGEDYMQINTIMGEEVLMIQIVGDGEANNVHPVPPTFFNEIALIHISYANVSLCI